MLQPHRFLCQGGTWREPQFGAGSVPGSSHAGTGALCAWLLALFISPPGCQHWPYIVTSCSQQSYVPAEAQLGALWAFGCRDSKWLNLALLPSLPEDTDDEVAQYLDHLLQSTTPQSNLPPTTQRGGLSRFRAAVHTTRDLMSLASKAKDLHVQSE